MTGPRESIIFLFLVDVLFCWWMGNFPLCGVRQLGGHVFWWISLSDQLLLLLLAARMQIFAMMYLIASYLFLPSAICHLFRSSEEEDVGNKSNWE